MKSLLLLICFTALMALFQLPGLQAWLQWEQHSIIQGQLWRIVTGNFTHTNLYHLSMNVLGLWVISFIFRSQISNRQFTSIILVLSMTVGVLLLLTTMQIYVGLSGVLHGLFGFYAIQEYRSGRKSSLFLAFGLIAKVIWEQVFGSATGSEALIGAKVALNAHLFGAVTGTFLGSIIKPKIASFPK